MVRVASGGERRTLIGGTTGNRARFQGLTSSPPCICGGGRCDDGVGSRGGSGGVGSRGSLGWGGVGGIKFKMLLAFSGS